jgi:SAM-dependent methyltransferase
MLAAMPGDRGPTSAPLSFSSSLRWPYIRRAMRECRPARTLEIGCGQGATAMRLTALTGTLTVVERDRSSRQVAAARLADAGVRICAELDEVDPSPAFDMVCAFEVLEHIQDDIGALRHWTSFIREGGHVLLSVPAWQELFDQVDESVGHFRRYSPEDLDARLAEAGLEVQWMRCYAWPVGRLVKWTQRRLVTRTGPRESVSTSDRTARSGRWLQPRSRLSGALRQASAVPFVAVQSLRPQRGTGLVALARRAR